MKIVFMGTPEFSVTVLESLYKIAEYEIVGVVSQPDKKVGRKQVLTPSPVSCFALSHNLPLFRIESIRKEFAQIVELDPDIIITCAYGQIVPIEILQSPKYGCINVHASLLPKYRGGSPIEYALLNGDKRTGITIMYMDLLMDNGDIITQEDLEILDSDNLETLTTRLSILGRDLLIRTLPSIFNGTNKRIKQDEKGATYAYNLKHEEEHLDFNCTCFEVFNKVRALSPRVGAFVSLNGQVIKVYDGYKTEDKSNKKPGTIEKIYKDGIGVSTKDFVYVIVELQVAGKKKMSAKNYLAGIHHDLVGEVYE